MVVDERGSRGRDRAGADHRHPAATRCCRLGDPALEERLRRASRGDRRRPVAARSVQSLSEGIEALQRASDHLGAASQHLVAYGSALGVDLGGAGEASCSTPTGRLVGDLGDLAGWIRDAGTSLPERLNDVGPTHGRLFSAEGVELADSAPAAPRGHLRSGAAAGAREGLRSDWYRAAQVIREHVESHAAAILRRPGAPREAVLVVNNEPCRTFERYVGCEEVLPGLLPVGSRLVVFVTDGRRTRLFAVYDGTGEGIAS